MSKDAQKAQKQRDNKTSRVVFSCIGVHLEIKTSVSWLKREKNQEHVKNFLDAKPLHFSSFITARCEDPLSADCNEITLLIWICICFLSGYRWTFWGHFSKNKLPFGCEKKIPFCCLFSQINKLSFVGCKVSLEKWFDCPAFSEDYDSPTCDKQLLSATALCHDVACVWLYLYIGCVLDKWAPSCSQT